MNQFDKRPEGPVEPTTEPRRLYKKPRILYREPLEAIANVCAKADASCSGNIGSSGISS